MKIYLIVVAAVLYMAALFGFVLPLLFSAEHTEAVLVGVGLLALAVPIGGQIFYRLLKRQMQSVEKKDEKAD